jgi:CheY-like chemotaxis protein
MAAGRVLLVDDEPEILRLLARRLARRGYEVTTAVGGQDALARARAGAFDLAVLDYMMPHTNGVELAGQCRALQPSLQVLILTGSPVTTEIEDAGYACLRKPLENLEHLDAAVADLVARARAHAGPGGAAGRPEGAG